MANFKLSFALILQSEKAFKPYILNTKYMQYMLSPEQYFSSWNFDITSDF